jgi:thymidylate synthase
MFPVTAMAELIWTLSGVKELDWLQQHTKMWDDFKNEENQIEASYGYRWRHQFERDQILAMLDALVKDPSDRQCVVMAWDNGKDGLGNRWTSNVPCPIGFIVNIIEGKVNITLMLRSSDAIVGLPYDMMMYSLLLILVTHELQMRGLNVRYGNITAILSHVHIYQPHYEIAESLVESARTWQNLAMDSYMYSVQDLNFNHQAINWRLLNISNAIENPDTSLELFKAIVNDQIPKIKPTHFKPEIIK